MLASRTVRLILQGFAETSKTELMTTFGTDGIFEAIQTDGTGFLCARKEIINQVKPMLVVVDYIYRVKLNKSQFCCITTSINH